MFQHFHLTRRQWFGILKWSVYVLVFLLTVVTQSAILSRLRPFGLKFSVVPILLVCICLREGPEKGGLFVLLGATFYALSGVDMGNVSLLVVTVCAVLSAFLCQTVLADRIFSAAVLYPPWTASQARSSTGSDAAGSSLARRMASCSICASIFGARSRPLRYRSVRSRKRAYRSYP